MGVANHQICGLSTRGFQEKSGVTAGDQGITIAGRGERPDEDLYGKLTRDKPIGLECNANEMQNEVAYVCRLVLQDALIYNSNQADSPSYQTT
jgi:hypothetical protein